MSEEKKKKLTDKEEAFCQAYVFNPLSQWNKAKSAEIAGYSKNSMYEIGAENYRKPHIRKRIEDLCKELRIKNEELITFTINEFKRIAEADMSDCIDEEGNIKKIKEIDGKIVKKYIKDDKGIKIELHDKLAALNGISKYTGMDKQVIEHTGQINMVKYDSDDEEL